MHPVFHVSLLKPYQTSIQPACAQPPTEPEEGDRDLE